MTKSEMITAMARLVSITLSDGDPEAGESLERLEAIAAAEFPKEHKKMEAAALNLALGHRTV